LMDAVSGSWAGPGLCLAHKCAGNTSHPPFTLRLHHRRTRRPMVADKSRLIELGHEVIAAAVAKRIP
jgi:hypothetical protein